MKTFRILVVDDEDVQRETLAQILRDQKYQVVTANSVTKARSLIEEMNFDIILTDFRMPGENGLDLARFSAEHAPETAVFIMTAYADVESVIESMRIGVVDYLLKPVNVDLLMKKLEAFQDRKELRSEVTQLRTQLQRRTSTNRLLGDSSAMAQVRELISQVAQTKSTVLITGESGTGKEVAARTIHQLSLISAKKFLAVNCGAIPENLLESELFGYKKGAFTGANSDKEGLFVSANGGTVFLDEIGEMPKGLQVKLLRVLQEREVTPVGTSDPIKVEVRLIAATNRDLQTEVNEGRFRQDLFYRINVVEIKMPSLRERRDDIPVLSTAIIERLSRDVGKAVDGLSNEALRRLNNYSWPGNVRELENVIERAIILNRGGKLIQAADLPAGFQNLGSENEISVTLEDALNAHARLHICKILEGCGGDKKEAAKLLGLSLSSLYRKLEELGISNKVAE